MWSGIKNWLSYPYRLAARKRELFHAVSCGETDHVLRILGSGVSPNLTESGLSLLTCAVWADQPAMVRLLLEHGADFGAPGNTHFVAYAAYRGNPEMIELGVRSGLDIDRRPRQFLSPLDAAISSNHITAIERLIDLGAKLKPHRNPRWFAVRSEVILYLAFRGYPVPPDIKKLAEDGEWG